MDIYLCLSSVVKALTMEINQINNWKYIVVNKKHQALNLSLTLPNPALNKFTTDTETHTTIFLCCNRETRQKQGEGSVCLTVERGGFRVLT